jgi:hypothetical protein
MTAQGDKPPRELRVCRAIRLLAAGQAPQAVARQVRVRPPTLAKWQGWAEFQALLSCMREAGQVRDVLAMLDDLTPDAIAALRRGLAGDDARLALQAAREVLDRVGAIRQKGQQINGEQTIRVEYVNRDGKAVSTASWADRHPAASGAVQGGGVRKALREDGDGQDSDD